MEGDSWRGGWDETRDTSEEVNFVQLGKLIGRHAGSSGSLALLGSMFHYEIGGLAIWLEAQSEEAIEVKGGWRVRVDGQQDQIISLRNLGTENTYALDRSTVWGPLTDGWTRGWGQSTCSWRWLPSIFKITARFSATFNTVEVSGDRWGMAIHKK